ncbi:MAG: serine--tRNA ligase [Bdellovibrionales bacterium]|nr:serine--tRNA ligase [Bdellovibrionales bacterium]
MIDPRLLRDSFAETRERLATRGLPEGFDSYPQLEEERRSTLQAIESFRAEKNRLGPEIAKAKKSGEDASELLAQLKQSSEQEKQLQQRLEALDEQVRALELLIPNIPAEDVPIGADESANRVEKQWGQRREFSFTPKPHWEIGESLGILDFEAAAKISGARFALYRGDGARLERALINFMLEEHRKGGYTELCPPLLVREEAMIGSGQLPKFAQDAFRTAGDDPRFLIPTSEVVMCNIHGDEILAGEQLPLYYTAFTPCFRAEAGSHGRDVRGLIRLHQFNKVELVKITTAETSFDELEKLTRDAERILELLELPYQRVTLSSGDMGIAATKTHDLEVWLPGMDSYREISSCSNTGDYQARRTKTRYRAAAGEKPRLVHMLNGSGLAVGRTVVAVLENYQQEDGTVVIPEVLRPWMGGQERIEPARRLTV